LPPGTGPADHPAPMTPLLEIRDLTVRFHKPGSPAGSGAAAVDRVSLSIAPGEALGLVGESGCGKSTLARTLMGLQEAAGGQVLFEGRDLAGGAETARREVRRRIQMVFQDPFASLNPRFTVGETLSEPLRVHRILPSADIPGRVRTLLSQVGLPARAADRYPHEFSGGQRQRIAIARALALGPSLLVADEPVSALDVSIQAQILNLIRDIRESLGLSLLFIAHDLSVVRHVTDRICVMYAGRIVEQGPAEAVIDRPLHPYTRALVAAMPGKRDRSREGLVGGEPPKVGQASEGCAFSVRCAWAQPACRVQTPALPLEGTHRAACLRSAELAGQ
jgi:oligopeptide transport system ATP-binding protein